LKASVAIVADFSVDGPHLDRDANVTNGGDSTQDAPFDEAAHRNGMDVKNLGSFGQGVDARRKFHKE
jgi:hypothetical protein